jgi:hypothetical protein
MSERDKRIESEARGKSRSITILIPMMLSSGIQLGKYRGFWRRQAKRVDRLTDGVVET